MAANQAIRLVEAELRETGYSEGLILRNYEYATFGDAGASSRTAALAAFAQAPPSVLTACIGVSACERDVREMRSLGAAMLIEVEGEAGRRWMNTAAGPQLLDKTPVPLRNLFHRYRREWAPDRIFRAKSIGAVDHSAQLDFVDLGLLPALESEARKKLDELIREVANAAVHTYSQIHLGKTPDEGQLFRLLFALITAKVLADTGILPGLDFSSPRELFRSIQRYNPLPDTTSFDDVVVREAAACIAGSFPFSNLSVDTLAYVYENTLVTSETRKKLSVHCTPSFIAEYVVNRLPIADIDLSRLLVCDPMCGHGTFLVAALRRLRTLLPNVWSPEERHKFFVEHISGRDIDPFSVEVARLALTLADLPNPDGWDIKQADAYTGNVLRTTAGKTTVFLTNPPFEKLGEEERRDIQATEATKAGELLMRVLPCLPVGALAGIILPIKFLEGRRFRRSRDIVAQQFEVIELLKLPDNVFEQSESETVLLIARKSPSLAQSCGYSIAYRSVVERDLDAFRLQRAFTRDECLPAEIVLGHAKQVAPTFWVPAFYSVWDALSSSCRVADIANIDRGVQFVSGLLSDHHSAVIKEHEFQHSAPGVNRVEDQLLPFHLHNVRWLSTDPAHRRRLTAKAWELPWSQPKVLLNATRRSRGPWRLIAAYDGFGLLATQPFHAVWPKNGTSALFLTAFFNSAIANAYVYDHELTRDNRVTTLECVPLPPLTSSVVATVEEIAGECVRKVAGDPTSDLTELLLSLDAELLKGYDLAPREEKQLLDTFAGTARPGCWSFSGFFPEGFAPAVPLHEYLSDEYQAARANLILSRLRVVDDSEISATLRYLREAD